MGSSEHKDEYKTGGGSNYTSMASRQEQSS